jgi:hypothetical protein
MSSFRNITNLLEQIQLQKKMDNEKKNEKRTSIYATCNTIKKQREWIFVMAMIQ